MEPQLQAPNQKQVKQSAFEQAQEAKKQKNQAKASALFAGVADSKAASNDKDSDSDSDEKPAPQKQTQQQQPVAEVMDLLSFDTSPPSQPIQPMV